MQMFRSSLAGIALLVASSSFAQSFDHSHSAWEAEVKKYRVANGMIRYRPWKKNRAPLDGYLKSLTNVKKSEFGSWSVGQRKAFLINAYNAFTIRVILDAYDLSKKEGLDSIKSLGFLGSGPWDKDLLSLLQGEITTLNEIEHDWLRKKEPFKGDARIHAAVNCASISCPVIRHEAFVAEKLESQLDDSTRQWLADKTRNQFAKGKVEVSEIFDWYEKDFGKNDQEVARFLIKFGPAAAKEALTGDFDIDYMDYDWDLNDAK